MVTGKFVEMAPGKCTRSDCRTPSLERILPIPVEPLNREDSFAYLRRCGINQEERMERMWYQSKGHPLALSLMVATQWPTDKAVREAGTNWFHELLYG